MEKDDESSPLGAVAQWSTKTAGQGKLNTGGGSSAAQNTLQSTPGYTKAGLFPRHPSTATCRLVSRSVSPGVKPAPGPRKLRQAEVHTPALQRIFFFFFFFFVCLLRMTQDRSILCDFHALFFFVKGDGLRQHYKEITRKICIIKEKQGKTGRRNYQGQG